MFRIRVAIPVVLGLVATSIVGLASPAGAVSVTQPNLVNAVPATYTPDVNNGIVYAINQVGNTVFMGGTFTSVSPHGSSTAYSDNYIAAFTSGTGALLNSFAPTLNGAVETITPGPTAGEVYVAGDFTTVDGLNSHVALLNISDGSLVSTWKPSAINGVVQRAILADGQLFIGGSFTTVGGVAHGALATLDPNTGKVTNYANLAFTGHHNYGTTCNPSTSSCANGTIGIKGMDIDPSGTHLVAIGNFTNVSGNARDQVALIDLGANSATVDPNWATAAYTAACFSASFDSYVRDVEFSPDGSYFVVVATGGSGTNSDGTNSSCDTAARFQTSATGSDIRPAWIDYTGQDTLLSVAITGGVVYVGGHQRWLNNSKGFDYAGPGAVPRPGIAALNPASGIPFSWNPGRNPRGAGAYALYASTTGLYVGSDTDYIGNYQYLHRKIAFFPLSGGENLPGDGTPTLPGRVYTAGAYPSPGSSNVLYRVDAGGPTIGATDGGPDWQGDTTDPSPYRNSGSNTASYSPIANVDSTVPASTPSAIFNTERWDPGSNGDGGEMHWAFPVPAGDQVDVRLYFANRYSGTSQPGQRVFDVAIDGQTFLNHFDIVAAAGDQTGTMRDETVTSDGEVDIDFTHEVENPLIDGIEIVEKSAPTTYPTPIYRINAGGEKIPATDGTAADWLADNSYGVGSGTAFRSGAANFAYWGEPWAGNVSASVPSSTPTNIFASEDWDSGSTTNSNDLHYSFPVAPGTPVTVKMFFANNCGCTSGVGQRVFNVLVDGQAVPALTNYDIVQDVGNMVGTMHSVDVTAPASGNVTIDFTHTNQDNPLINGIEVDQDGATPTSPTQNVDQFSYRHFDGTTPGAVQQLNTGISWGSIRGAFTVNGEIIYGMADGNLYERTFDGSNLGQQVELDPYDDPYWDQVQTGSGQTYQGQRSDMSAEMSSVSSMFFTNGRLYYTLAGSSAMHWRWFEPESGVVGSDEFTTTDSNNWSNVAGAFLSGNTLYYADKTTGDLSSIAWNGTQATGSPTVVDTTQDWASRGMFMLADATNPNQPPVANFTATCSTTSTACTIDPTASYDPDGSITDYAYTFGNNPVEHHPTSAVFSHDFGSPGTYTVTLTVTDNDGATGTKTEQVVVGETTPVPTFGGATTACGPGTGSCGSSAVTNVAVPGSTAVNDALLMFVSWPTSTTTTASVPAGWHLLSQNVSSPLESDVYYRAASASDIGTTIPVTFSAKTKNSVTLADYSGADPNTIEAFAKNTDSSTASHTTPTATVSTPGSLAVSYWTDKSSTTTAWTAPAAVTARTTFYDTGGGYVTSLLADSGHTVNSGPYGGLTATTNAASGKGAEWTIILGPAGATNTPPVAAFTSNCTNLTCTFNGGGSTDPDGTIASYAWTFGDGHSQAASSSPTASNTYAAGGNYQVTLTVTDNGGATNSITHTVSPSAPAKNIGFVGASTYDNSGTSGTVTVPAAASAGDTLLLYESHASTSITAAAPTGWTLVGSTSFSNLRSAVYEKTATAADASSPVTVNFSAAVKASVTLADYTNTANSPIEAEVSSTAASTSTHTTPSVSGLSAGSWVVSFWTDKSTTTKTWTPPGSVTQRSVVYGSGTAAVSALLADSGAGVSGNYAGQTATTDASSGSAAQWTVALSPAT
jgi:PKD repeat protein